MRAGVRLANARGVTAVHDKDGWLGALRPLAAARGARPADAARVAVDPARPGRLRRRGRPALRARHARCCGSATSRSFMDGTLGSQTAWMLDGSGVQITSGEELAEIVRRGAAAGFPVAVHAIGDRANREALDAFEQTTRRLGAARPAPPHRARAAARARGSSPASPSVGVACSVQFSHAPSDRDLADRYWAGKTDGAYAFRSLLDSGAVARRTAATRRSRSSTRSRASAPAFAARSTTATAWHPEQALTVDQAFHATCVAPAWLARDERRRGTLLPGKPPTSSCSTATRGTTSTRRSSRRWSPAAGCTTRRPGTERRARA